MAIAIATATFTSATDSVAVTWSGITSSAPKIEAGVTVTDGGGPVVVDLVSVTNTGCTVQASAPFGGTVTLAIED